MRQLVGGQKATEALVALLASAHTGSVTLAAFALVSGADLVGVLSGREPQKAKPESGRPVSRLLGFGALGAGGYLLLRASHTILAPVPPDPKLIGEGIVGFSIMLTVGVFWVAWKRQPPSRFDPAEVIGRVVVRLLLAASTLTGLVLNSAFELWMADPLSALPAAGFFFFTGENLLRAEQTRHRPRASLPKAGELLASIVAHVGAEHAGRSPLRVIVCGGGRLGLHTARALTKDGHDVSIVEEDEARCRKLGEEYAGAVIFGNAADPDVLRRAGVKRGDVVAALSGSAQANHRICRAAEREATVRTVMRAPFATESPEEQQTGVRSLGALDGGNLRILELRVAAGAPIAGQRLSGVQLPRGGHVLSTADGERADEAKMVFAPGERYIVAASEKATRAITHLFRGHPRPSKRSL